MPRPQFAPAKPAPRHAWLWEPLEHDATFVLRPMFGFKAAYLHGKITLVFCEKEEPWRGIMVATDREHHESLIATFPDLTIHAVLGKWLYLSESSNSFESIAQQIVRLVRQRDARIGVIPKPKKRKKSAGLSGLR